MTTSAVQWIPNICYYIVTDGSLQRIV